MIAILAILLAILIPVAQRVMIHANLAVCASNQRQISAATKLYLADNDGIYMDHRYNVGTAPPYDPTRHPAEYTWFDALLPYLTEGVYHCPDYPESGFNAHDIGIGQNSFFLGQMDHRDGETGGTRIASKKDFPVALVRQPSMCIEYGDSEKKWGSFWGLTLWWPYINQAQEGVASHRHGGAGVVTFVDGHSKIFRNPDQDINPSRDNSAEYIEYWDPLQRRDLWP